MNKKQWMLAASLSLVAWGAQALQISSFSPQGEVAQVRQVVAKFDAAAVNFGDPKAPAPLTLSCSDAQVTKGNGRWVNDRVWAFEFENDLPPGISCTVQAKAGFQSPPQNILPRQNRPNQTTLDRSSCPVAPAW